MLQMKWKTWRYGKLVGTDTAGNKYYEDRRGRGDQRHARRWIMYADSKADPTTIPVAWFGWLHYTHEAPLDESTSYTWQKPRLPNQTGTPEAYRPPASYKVSAERASNAAYEPWRPDQS